MILTKKTYRYFRILHTWCMNQPTCTLTMTRCMEVTLPWKAVENLSYIAWRSPSPKNPTAPHYDLRRGWIWRSQILMIGCFTFESDVQTHEVSLNGQIFSNRALESPMQFFLSSWPWEGCTIKTSFESQHEQFRPVSPCFTSINDRKKNHWLWWTSFPVSYSQLTPWLWYTCPNVGIF